MHVYTHVLLGGDKMHSCTYNYMYECFNTTCENTTASLLQNCPV